MRIIEDPGEGWSAANPATVVDRDTGRVWVLYLRSKPGRSSITSRPGTDDIQTFARYSDDNGSSWSDPIDLTDVARDMNDPGWRCSVTGPGGMVQTRGGRLVAPAWKAPYTVLAIFSDDHGRTWQRSQSMPGRQLANENQIVELADGRLLMDCRQSEGTHRWITTSENGDATWSVPVPGETVSPVACAIQRLTLAEGSRGRNRIIWTGPKGPGRNHLVVPVSYDEGKTFVGERTISEEPAAYSDMTITKDGHVGVLWERGGYKFLTFTRFSLGWLEADN